MKTAFILFLLLLIYSTTARSQQTFNNLSVKDLASNKITVTSTTSGSKPCPAMTEAQRNAIASPLQGQCIYNTSSLNLNVYNGTTWASAGGGISNWQSSFNYALYDVVIESFKIYQANTAHTSSGSFASDLANWSQLAYNVSDATGVLPIANGGTNSSTALSGSSIAISNGSAIVQGSAGTATTLLHGNASGAPTYSSASLTSDVSGTLPISNGGTNSLTALLGSSVMVSNGSSVIQGPLGTTSTVLHGDASGIPSYGSVILTSEVSGILPLSSGGTNKNITPVAGGVFWSDGDSFELIAAGTFPQLLRSNGTSAPDWFTSSLTDKTCRYLFGGAAATLAVPTECTTGTCTEVEDSCATGSPPAFNTTAGRYDDLVFSNGTFANSTPVFCSCSAFDTTTDAARDCDTVFSTADSSWSSSVLGGLTINFRTFAPDGTVQNTYVILSCTGDAP